MRMRASTRVCMCVCERERERVRESKEKEKETERERVCARESFFNGIVTLSVRVFLLHESRKIICQRCQHTRKKNKIGFTFGFKECTIITSRKGKCDYSMRKFPSK